MATLKWVWKEWIIPGLFFFFFPGEANHFISPIEIFHSPCSWLFDLNHSELLHFNWYSTFSLRIPLKSENCFLEAVVEPNPTLLPSVAVYSANERQDCTSWRKILFLLKQNLPKIPLTGQQDQLIALLISVQGYQVRMGNTLKNRHTLAVAWLSISSTVDECWLQTLMLVFSCIFFSYSRTSSIVISVKSSKLLAFSTDSMQTYFFFKERVLGTHSLSAEAKKNF